jgi:hypothetical protein
MATKDNMNLIGITGKAGTGKDTLADYLVEKHGFHRYGFADPIKELLNEFFGWKPHQWLDRDWKESPQIIDGSIPGLSWSPRQLAQWLGTEVGRNTFGQDCWIKRFERYYECLDSFDPGATRFVISDVRFNNEAVAIRRMGGTIIHLTRTGLNEVSSHISEAGIEGDFINIHYANNGTILQLHDFADFILR